MRNIFEISEQDVTQLTNVQITDILGRLLIGEAIEAGLPRSCIHMTLNITIPDGGIDAKVEWEGLCEKTEWIKNRVTGFQCKATDMGPSDCVEELISKGNIKLEIDRIFINNGCYILFINRCMTDKQKRERIDKMKEAIADKPYWNMAQIDIYGADDISRWINKYMSIVLKTLEYLHRPLADGICSWEMWAKYYAIEFEYVQDTVITNQLNELRDYYSETRKIGRIVGLSGTGKTRLALEAFRAPLSHEENSIQFLLSKSVIYIKDADVIPNLPAIISSLRNEGYRGILIADNCQAQLHEKLIEEVNHPDSNFSLLSIDNNPEEAKGQTGRHILFIRPSSDEVIKGILKQKYEGKISKADIDRIAAFSNGFPSMAVHLANARLNEEIDIGVLNDSVMMRKLLWGSKPEDKDKLKALSVCSLFDNLGIEDNVDYQLQFAAQEIGDITPRDLYATILHFQARGLIDKRGRYIKVIPMPLAIRLAADWWECCLPKEAITLILKLANHGLLESFCKQFKYLHFSPKAKNIVGNLCGDESPFGRAEVLNTEEGSRLFRSFAEVNPKASVDLLNRAFGNYSIEEIRDVRRGRRNLIWALENLCFWEYTFEKAARLLLLFAAGENETWGNNATGQFIQLFRLYLSGTQAPLNKRFIILKEALEREEYEYNEIALKALGEALETRHFTRSGGVESQGSRAPEKDWEPRTYEEMHNYWDLALDTLSEVACKNKALVNLAKEILENRITGLILSGRIASVDKCLRSISKCLNNFWPDLIERLTSFINVFKAEIPPGIMSAIEDWINLFDPNLFSDRLRLFVSEAPFLHKKDATGEYVDVSAEKAAIFAKECKINLECLLGNLHVIYAGNQRQGFAFGKELGKLLDRPEEFIEKSIEALYKINSNELNVIVLGAFLSEIQKTKPLLTEKIKEKFETDNILVPLYLQLLSCLELKNQDLLTISNLINSGRLPVHLAKNLSYGGMLSKIDPESVCSFCENILKKGPEVFPTVISILYMYTFTDPQKFDACRHQLEMIFLTKGILSNPIARNGLEFYEWTEIATKLLNDENNNKVARNICMEIVDACLKDDEFYRIDHHFDPVIIILMSKYGTLCWPIITDTLITDANQRNYMFQHNLINLLNPHGPEPSNSRVIPGISENYLIEWCDKNIDKGPLILAKTVQLVIAKSWEWHPFALRLIDNYGDRNDFMHEIWVNIGPFSWSGSRIPMLENKLSLLKPLLDHPKAIVSIWAGQMTEYLINDIESAKMGEIEQEFGIY